MNILLVEDEPIILMDIEFQLEQAGHIVHAAPNADKAIDLLAHQSVDLLLTDIDMPGSMDGLGLAAIVRDRWPPTRIVVMSGKRRPRDHELPSSARFLPKPFSDKSLSQALTGWN